MADLATIEKTCTVCGETKPLSGFYRKAGYRYGRDSKCKECALATVNESKARRRAEMGEEAWLALQRDQVRRSRTSASAVRRQQMRAAWTARNDAVAELVEQHRAEFDAIHRRIKYERGLLREDQ